MLKANVKCVLCGEVADPDSPYMNGAIYERNPKTLRMAWMHADCFQDELKILKKENKYEKYELMELGMNQ